MAKEIFNRIEKKYLLTKDQYEEILKILPLYMNKDKFNENDKKYLISNIYYDTQNDDLIRQSLQKPIYKEKLRLRSYGPKHDDDFVFLEIKKKFNGLVNKRRTKLTLRDANEFIQNGTLSNIESYMNPQVVKEIEFFLKQYKVQPKVYLSYERLAYFAKDDDDLRLTIDTNIRADRKNLSLKNFNIGDKLLDDSNFFLMEIKSSKTMPIWLVNVLSENEIYATSFSKYGKEYKNYIDNKQQQQRRQDTIVSKKTFDRYKLKFKLEGDIYGYTC